MTQQQIIDLVRQVLQVLGTVATAFGFMTPDAVATWIATAMQIVGPLAMVGAAIWGFLDARKAKQITNVANMDEVKSVTLEPAAAETPALNQATPSNVRPG